MKRTSHTFQIQNIADFKAKLLIWAQKFKTAVWLDSNNYQQTHSNFDAVLAVDIISEIKSDYHHAFEQLKKYQTTVNDYIFGFLSYDLKNDVENLTSNNFDGLHFADLCFFQPKKIFFIKGNTVEVKYISNFKNEINADLEQIRQQQTNNQQPTTNNQVKIKLRIHKDDYYKKLNTVLNHIQRGDIYEANFCQEFYSENANIDPVEVYQNLNTISKPPFATFLKLNDKFLLSASPERYLKKDGEFVISQPIKGTEKRATNL